MGKNKIHLLVPMSGQGTRYARAGYSQPKPLIPVSGVPMISRLMECFPADWPRHFVMAENHRQTQLPQFLAQLAPAATLQYVPTHSEGPIRAIEEALEKIPDEAPVFVTYCDYGMVWDVRQFERFVQTSQCDVCLVSYRGFHAHYLSEVPYAYSRLEDERVVEVREKGSFTNDRETEYASTGGYYFRTGAILKKAVAAHRKSQKVINGEFYTSLTVQALLESEPQTHARIFEIPGFFQWGTPDDLRAFEYWERTFNAYNREIGATRGEVSQVLIPMAGAGTRLAAVAGMPKPLVKVIDRPMFQKALSSLPRGHATKLVALESMRPYLEPALDKKISVVYLQTTPPGQAVTTLEGIKELDHSKDVLISACDHSVVLNHKKWDQFKRETDVDAAIFTLRGFPGARRRPNAYAYVVPEADSHETFPKIKNVSVKKAVSDHPENDHLLVGTFWIRSADLLEKKIAEYLESGDRVNNEYYLDSVFGMMVRQGLNVRMIELEGYINWGDEDSLAEALYWYEIFVGKQIDKRERWPGVARRTEK